MYICIDVGGTKTLVAILDENGVIAEQTKIPTSQDYQQFLNDITKAVSDLKHKKFVGGAIAVPGKLDRDNNIARNFGNLPWKNVSVASDIEKIVNTKVLMENDAKLGGLSEAMLVKDQFKRVLYITVSTGIGYAFIDHLKIDISVSDGGGHIMLVNRGSQDVIWESLASGRAITQRYGKLAKDIYDEGTWQKISADLAAGLIILVAVFEPEVIIIGGSVGVYFDRYANFLQRDLASYQLPLVETPIIKGAQRANEAVIYGCYDYAKQRLNNE